MAIDSLNKLCKWRMVLAGWHTGSKALLTPTGTPNPGVKAMRDLMDKWLIMRAETNALAGLLIKKRVFTSEEFTAAILREADHIDHDMERVFPGFRTSEEGVVIYDLDMARKTVADLGFPQ